MKRGGGVERRREGGGERSLMEMVGSTLRYNEHTPSVACFSFTHNYNCCITSSLLLLLLLYCPQRPFILPCDIGVTFGHPSGEKSIARELQC